MADAESDFDTVFQVTTDSPDHHEDISDLQTTSQDRVELVSPCFDTPNNTVHVASTTTHENKVVTHNNQHKDDSALNNDNNQVFISNKDESVPSQENNIKDSIEVATMTDVNEIDVSIEMQDKLTQTDTTEAIIVGHDDNFTQTDTKEDIKTENK